MPPQVYIAAAMALLDYLEPRISEWRKEGTVTPEEQDALKARIDSFRDGSAFQGPEWQLSQTGSTPPPAQPS